MIVELLAHTVVTGWGAMRDAGWVDHQNGNPDSPGDYADWCNDADELAEFAGRLCYKSWSRPNPATATNASYLAHIIESQHFSVLEHSSATFYVAGVSRSLSHELVRHRHLSFSQVSQRYVDESLTNAVLPPAVDGDAVNSRIISGVAASASYAYAQLVLNLQDGGLSRKEARQAARAVLPNATATAFVVTGNMRAWRDVIAKRNTLAADVEIRRLAVRILGLLQEVAPNTFQDMHP